MTMRPECPVCGSIADPFAKPFEVVVGRWKRSIEVEGFRCASCSEEFFVAGQLQAALRNAAAVLREARGLISPERIKALRERHRLTQSQLEKLLNVGPKTVARWERGTVVPALAVSRFIETLEAHPSIVGDLAARYQVVLPPLTTIGWWMQTAIPEVRGDRRHAVYPARPSLAPECFRECAA